MPVNAALLLDLADEVEHLLRAAHREAGDDHVAAPVEGFLQYAGQRGKIVRHGAVEMCIRDRPRAWRVVPHMVLST